MTDRPQLLTVHGSDRAEKIANWNGGFREGVCHALDELRLLAAEARLNLNGTESFTLDRAADALEQRLFEPRPATAFEKAVARGMFGGLGGDAQRLDRKQAQLSGYTGDQCNACQSMQVKRNGSCLVCEACGTTTGCS